MRCHSSPIASFAALLLLVGCGGAPFTVDALDVDGGGAPEGAVTVLIRVSDAGAIDGGAATDSQTDSSDAGLPAVDGPAEATGAPEAGPCDGGPIVTHSNGVGQTWQDCVPLGTYDATEATRACAAFTGTAAQCYLLAGCGGATEDIACADTGSGNTRCWGFSVAGEPQGISGYVSEVGCYEFDAVWE